VHLDLLNIQVGELLAAQRAADQQCEDRVIALSFNRRAVGDRKQLFCLLPGQPVAEPSSLLRDIRDLGQIRGLFGFVFYFSAVHTQLQAAAAHLQTSSL
jgi:hypothetical protein